MNALWQWSVKSSGGWWQQRLNVELCIFQCWWIGHSIVNLSSGGLTTYGWCWMVRILWWVSGCVGFNSSKSIEAKSLLGIPSQSRNPKQQFKKHTDDSWQLDLDGSLCKSRLWKGKGEFLCSSWTFGSKTECLCDVMIMVKRSSASFF
jgi:hypothetical protein